jgi:hypothetical protein
MADTVLNTTVFDGAKKLITHYNVVSDSTGSTTKIAPADAIRMQWDADTDVVFQTLAGEMEFDYSDFGGLKNTEATGFTGDVNVVLPACTSGDTGTIVCEWIKVYES